MTKIFFPITLNGFANVKPNAKQQEMEALVAVLCNLLYKVSSKLEIHKSSMYFSLNLTWYFIHFGIVR